MSYFQMLGNPMEEIMLWWLGLEGSKDGERRLHWKKWKNLCQPKCLRGLGFRKLNVFNEALLMKQVWRTFNNPNSLVAKVLKVKYFPRSNFLNSARGLNLSYALRRIWGSKAWLKQGLISRLENGANVRIWKAHWVDEEKGVKLDALAYKAKKARWLPVKMRML